MEYEDIISSQGILNKDVFQKDSTKKGIEFKNNDILFGKLRPYLNKWLISSFHGIAVGDFWVFRTHKIESRFIFYLIQTNKFRMISNISTGTRMPRSDWNIVSTTQFYIPKINSEAQRISQLISYIDNYLNLHQRKTHILGQIKKTYLQKIFPKKDSNVPELRFYGYNTEWEINKLKEVALFNPKSKLPNIFQYVDLESVVGINLISSRIESKERAPSRAQRLAKKGDVFYQTVRPYQKNNYLFELSGRKFVFSSGYAQMRPYINSYFLLSKLQDDRFVSSVLDRCTGTSYPAINSRDLAEIIIHIPDSQEQKNIGDIFKYIDNTITVHQSKLELLTKIKSTFVKKMFI